MNQESPTNPETTLKGDNLLQPAQTPATPPPPQKQEASPVNENPNPTPRLTLFTDLGLMEKVDRSFLRSLLETYRECLPPAAAELFARDGELLHQPWYTAWAAQFQSVGQFGAPLLEQLLAIEWLAQPENQPLLEAALANLPPEFEVNRGFPLLHQALHLWLIASRRPEVTFPVKPGAKCERGPAESANGANGRELNQESEKCAASTEHPVSSTQSPALSTENPPPAVPIENQKALSDNPEPATTPARTAAAAILDALVAIVCRFAVLPKWVPETVALFIFHTFAWELRDVTTYLGIESPQHRCGKSTLLTIIRRLCNRPEGAAHISGPAMFRTIDKGKPTLIVDETEKLMKRNQLLQGILNASYSRELAYVVRVIPVSKKKTNGAPVEPIYVPIDDPSINHQPSTINSSGDDVAHFSCWCPKAMAQIGHFSEVFADRCIIITMQRKTPLEKCERVRKLKASDAAELRRRCAEFVAEHREAIARAEPALPEALNDRAADIWEPLFVLADLAGGDWPEKARQAALALSGAEQSNSLISSLLLDCLVLYIKDKADRMFTRDLVQKLNAMGVCAWRELAKGKPIDDLWLAKQLRPFGIRPQTLRIGQELAKGYLQEDFVEPTHRYVSKADWEAYLETIRTSDGKG